jgi:DNA polymerase-1
MSTFKPLPKSVLLIDGRNMMFRMAYAFKDLSHNGEPTGVVYGFLKGLVTIWSKWYTARVVVCWDSKPARRIAETEAAIKEGILTEEQGRYKENRKRRRDEDSTANELYESVQMQEDTVYEMLNYTLAHQRKMDDVEADDIIGTLARQHEASGDQVFIVSSDHDFYQLLSPKISIFDPLKEKTITYEDFKKEHDIEPHQWIDVGALQGDKGDNIHGVPGVGPKTAVKYVRMHSDVAGVFAGLRTASAEGRKLSKREEAILESDKIVKLAYSLKRIDTDLDIEPISGFNESDPDMLVIRFDDLGFSSLMQHEDLLTKRTFVKK